MARVDLVLQWNSLKLYPYEVSDEKKAKVQKTLAETAHEFYPQARVVEETGRISDSDSRIIRIYFFPGQEKAMYQLLDSSLEFIGLRYRYMNQSEAKLALGAFHEFFHSDEAAKGQMRLPCRHDSLDHLMSDVRAFKAMLDYADILQMSMWDSEEEKNDAIKKLHWYLERSSNFVEELRRE